MGRYLEFYLLNQRPQNTINEHNKKGDSFDTSHTNVETKCGGKVNIFSTYASPLISKKLFIFTNGVVEQNDDKLEIRGPTENYNKMEIL